MDGRGGRRRDRRRLSRPADLPARRGRRWRVAPARVPQAQGLTPGLLRLEQDCLHDLKAAHEALREVGAGYRRADPQGRLSRRRAPAIGARNQQAAPSASPRSCAPIVAGSRGLIKTRPQSGFYVTRPLARPAGGQSRHGTAHRHFSGRRQLVAVHLAHNLARAIPCGSPYPDPAGLPSTSWPLRPCREQGRLVERAAQRPAPRTPPAAAADRAAPPTRAWSSIRPSPSSPWARPRPSPSRRPWPPGDVTGGNAHLLRDAARHRAHGHERWSRFPPIRSWASTWTCLPGWPASYPSPPRMVMPNFQNPLGFRMPDERKATPTFYAMLHGDAELPEPAGLSHAR